MTRYMSLRAVYAHVETDTLNWQQIQVSIAKKAAIDRAKAAALAKEKKAKSAKPKA